MTPQLFKGIAFPLFGPDTSTGVIPQPHLLLYYGMFFAFGVAYFESGDNAGKRGQRWWILLPLALVVIVPIGLATISQRPIAVVIQPICAWMMSIGMMGLFRATVNRPNAVF